MKKNNLIIFSVSLLFIFSSCVKQKDQLLAPREGTGTSLASIQVTESFDWSTTKKVDFTFTGKAESDYQLMLKVISNEKTVIFQKLQKSNEDYKDFIEIPAHYESVTVSFGSLSKTFDCKDGSINMTIDN